MEDIRYVFLMNITDNNTTDNNKVSSAEIKPSLLNRFVLWYYKVKLIHTHIAVIDFYYPQRGKCTR